ncbi:MAG: hypothetical protein JXA71_06960, partial [Chitinispirillaceae bacterium]|nr:hypothetical protein [Chitinispirillaceae bacterium]
MHPCLSDTVPVFREVGIASETAVFLENIEYNNSYRKGETVFGALEKGRFIFRPVHSADVAIGICALRRFGDERFLSRAIPLLRVRLFMPNWSFALGEIDAQDCHGLPDLLYRRERRYDPGTEEGAQFRIQTARTAIDLWVHWDSLNSPLHRERFI